jgi:DMSO/TMAO reductase YedYZ molybdopterin-dependent catalytic subunit
MRQSAVGRGAVLGGLTSLPALALLYLGEQLASLPFVPFDLFDWLARVLPGSVVTAGIDALVRLITALNLGAASIVAKRIEQASALLLFVLGGAILGVAIVLLLRRRAWSARQAGAIGGIGAFFLISALEFGRGGWHPAAGTLLALAFLIVGWGVVLGAALGGTLREAQPNPAARDQISRRALLRLAGGSLVLALGAWGLARLLAARDRATGAGQPLAPPAPAMPTLPARTGVAPAPGSRAEVTPNAAFYRIDINTRPPRLDGGAWMLEVTGLFAKAHPLTLASLTAYPTVTQPITLSCISNEIGGDLISTSYWTGVRLPDLLQDLGVQPEAKALAIQAADGFYESLALEDMRDPRVLLVYGMNGQTLPIEHGYPLRIYIPNRYGMKQPKWITRIEAIDHPGAGYWVDRGWSKEARPQVLAIIDSVAQDQTVAGRVPIGGIAWAGDRGIRTVELQVDGGTWDAAQLLTPPLSPLTWVLWRYDWPVVAGRHTFRVRATDGTGALQIEQPAAPHPNGATGYHAVTVAFA